MILRAILLILLLPSLAWPSWYTFNGVDSRVHITSATFNLATFTACVDTIRAGDGGGGFGRIFEQAAQYIMLNQSAAYEFRATLWMTTDGVWTVARPTQDVRTHFCLAYDGSSAANDPVIWFNGVSQTVTETATPAGAGTPATNAWSWGNSNSLARAWDGAMGNACTWNRVLTTNEVLQVVNYGCQSLVSGLLSYLPLGAFGVIDYGPSSLTWTGAGTLTASDTGPVVSAPQGGFSWW